MRFGMIGQMGPVMKQVVEFGNWSTGQNFLLRTQVEVCNVCKTLCMFHQYTLGEVNFS